MIVLVLPGIAVNHLHNGVERGVAKVLKLEI